MAQVEALVRTVKAMLAKNPTERAVSARMKELKQAMIDYGEKHFALLHRVKDNVELTGELIASDEELREKYYEQEDAAEALLETFRIAAQAPPPSYDLLLAGLQQAANGARTAAIKRGSNCLHTLPR